MTDRICDGRVVIVTGAGRGIGREYALEFARQGASVVVNDLGSERDGSGMSSTPAQEVVTEIRSFGGEAIANGNDIADIDGAKDLIETAVREYGQLDVLVNNAGILRDRMIVNMDIDEWDAVIRVHLRGTFAPTRWAAAHWRERFKAGQVPIDARLINTTSSSGIFANPGQANYAAAKAGIASFTIVASRELGHYGVTANAVYPTALSRMTEDIFSKRGLSDNQSPPVFDPLDPANFAPVVVWLGSSRSSAITGRVFGLRGGRIVVAEGWAAGPAFTDQHRWDTAELDQIVPDLVGRAAPNVGVNGQRPEPPS